MKRALSLLLFVPLLSCAHGQFSGDDPLRDKDKLFSGPPVQEFSGTDSPFFDAEAIQDLGTRNLYEMATLLSTDIQYDGGQELYYRNAPAQIYVDGVKIRGPVCLPKKAVGEIRVGVPLR